MYVFKWMYGVAQSPIEKIMGEALSIIHVLYFDGYGDCPWLVELRDKQEDESGGWLWRVTPQFKVGAYKVDFLVECSLCPDKKLAVECDGHDFHEKTKAQAQHDKSRDRCLLSNGVATMRFTGSEIFNDPCGCVLEVARYFQQHSSFNDMWRKAGLLWEEREHGPRS